MSMIHLNKKTHYSVVIVTLFSLSALSVSLSYPELTDHKQIFAIHLLTPVMIPFSIV